MTEDVQGRRLRRHLQEVYDQMSSRACIYIFFCEPLQLGSEFGFGEDVHGGLLTAEGVRRMSKGDLIIVDV